MLLRTGQLDAAEVQASPFPLLVARDVLDPAYVSALDADFPRYRGAGYFPHDDADCGDSVTALVAELTSPGFAEALGARLGIAGMSRHPPLVTICRSLNARHGSIHTDSLSKVASALLYLNPSWPDGSHAGCLRFLSAANDIDATLVPEIPPIYGTLAAFKRTECSWHGHLPFEGERHVIQVAWLVDEKARSRKTRRGRWSRFVKWVAGRADRALGKHRDRNAAHMD
ncbi:MAG: 2OG-Fe(II) oxygenase [Lysobacter sp.]|nr:2OG-Fe(II) oxygenase [Lysobacter sp.]